MTFWTLVLKSAVYFRRTNGAVLAGVAVASAVLTGALLVGDSVRGSLRHLALDRLGYFESVLVTDSFFRTSVTEELLPNRAERDSPAPASDSSFGAHSVHCEPIILLAGTIVEHRTSHGLRRATQVTTLGISASFWQQQPNPPPLPELTSNQVVINRQLAEELQVQVGDELTVRLPAAVLVPADSTLAQKSNRVLSLPRLQVAAIVDNTGLGRFGLQLQQSLPRNLYLTLATLQDALDRTTEVNAILVAVQPPSDDERLLKQHAEQWTARLRPGLHDLGLDLQRVRRTFSNSGTDEQVIYDYWQLTSRRLLIPNDVYEAVSELLDEFHGQAVMTYLADSIRLERPATDGAEEIPYSIITGIDSTDSFRLLPAGEVLGDEEIILNSWTADRLKARVGDRIIVEYFEPETAHGQVQRNKHVFTLRAIVPITEPVAPYRRNRPPQFDKSPTLFNDPDLTPQVPGITDQETIDNWDAPFPFDIRRVQRPDDQYWQNHRTTPKAFVNLRTAQRLWGSRFGKVTSIRFPTRDGITGETLTAGIEEALRAHRATHRMGWVFQPIRAQALAASRGSTPFDVLFLALSSFLMMSAVLLAVLLFRLAMELRASQLGLLSAVGWPRWQAVWVWTAEGLLITAVGAGVGLVLAIGYSRLIIAGLNSPRWWLGAIAVPFLQPHVRGASLGIGYLSSLLLCGLSIAWAARSLGRRSSRQLLAGQISHRDLAVSPGKRFERWLLVAAAAGAVVLGVSSLRWEGELRAAGFVGSGFLLLVAALLAQWRWLRSTPSGRTLSFLRLAALSAARNPTRSTLTISLMAAATFLIVALSAFRVQPDLRGSGGFRLVGESSLPIYEPLSTEAAALQSSLLGDGGRQNGGAASTRGVRSQQPTVIPFRVKAGDDASCRNLYQVQRPRVLGVPRRFAERYDDPAVTPFRWASAAAPAHNGDPAAKNPWHLLWQESHDAVPVVLDANTAVYSLHWTGGVGSRYTVEFDSGQQITFRIVGLLSNSLLQGQLLIAEEQFTKLFPEVSGYQFFLADVADQEADAWRGYWEDRHSDQGLAWRQADRVLSELLAVQNTYLSTFQTLGALGVLLGTVGVAVVQARSVLERRGELALLQAVGFRRGRLAALVLLENATLLAGGLSIGVLTAMMAVVPYAVTGGATVPGRTLAMLLGAIVVAGIVSSLAAVRLTLRAPLVPALRGE